jgi:hypothetical protein
MRVVRFLVTACAVEDSPPDVFVFVVSGKWKVVVVC